MQVTPSRAYIIQRIKELQHTAKEKSQNLQRLSAIRDEMNDQVRALREEIVALQEPASYVGEFIKLVGKDKALVKMSQEGKYIVSINKSIKRDDLKANVRVALKKDSYELHKILPSNVDPLVSLMKVRHSNKSQLTTFVQNTRAI